MCVDSLDMMMGVALVFITIFAVASTLLLKRTHLPLLLRGLWMLFAGASLVLLAIIMVDPTLTSLAQCRPLAMAASYVATGALGLTAGIRLGVKLRDPRAESPPIVITRRGY